MLVGTNPLTCIPTVAGPSAAERKRSPPAASASAPLTTLVKRGVQVRAPVAYWPPEIALRLAPATSIAGSRMQVLPGVQRETVRVVACEAIKDASSRALGPQSAAATAGSELT